METRSITAIANDMERLAKRSADVKRLYGAQLIAYKRLEVELAQAKIAKAEAAVYADQQYLSKGELVTVSAADLRSRAIQSAKDLLAVYAAELKALEVAR